MTSTATPIRSAPSSPLPSKPSLRPSSVPPEPKRIDKNEAEEQQTPDPIPNPIVSSLALPKPLIHNVITPSRRPSSRPSASRVGITPIVNLEPPLDVYAPSFTDSIPRSLKTLGSSTLRPPLKPVSLAGTTLRPNTYQREIGEYQNILQHLWETSDGSNTERGIADHRGRIILQNQEMPLEVDELGCEWCWFCGCERVRDHLDLKDVGGGDGMQWVCRGVCGDKEMGVGEWGQAERLRRVSGESGSRGGRE